MGGGSLLEVRLREGESIEELLGRFRRGVQRSGLLGEVRRRAHFVSRSERERMAARRSARKAARKARKIEERLRRSGR
ncbi:MAG: 30S ribosomal protein S21 [Chloroflexota bacterium]|nr:MAG: 30S ribosomal protein S21 [Chloroflexota bacterium]